MRTQANSRKKRIGVEDAGARCPRCNEPTSGSSTDGPGTETYHPCGCVLAADGSRDLVALHREDVELLHELAARQLRDDRATVAGGALEASDIGYDDYTMGDVEGVLEDVQDALTEDADDAPDIIPDGGQDLADVECPRCQFDGGEPALGMNLCSECGGWFHVHADGRTLASTGPGRPIADGGHGNYYDVDGEQDADQGDDELERSAIVERHEDGGYLITDGAGTAPVQESEPITLQESEAAMLRVLDEMGHAGGVLREVKTDFADATEYAETTASALLSTLEKKGVVEKRANIREPMASIWTLSPEGQRLVTQLGPATPGDEPAAGGVDR